MTNNSQNSNLGQANNSPASNTTAGDGSVIVSGDVRDSIIIILNDCNNCSWQLPGGKMRLSSTAEDHIRQIQLARSRAEFAELIGPQLFEQLLNNYLLNKNLLLKRDKPPEEIQFQFFNRESILRAIRRDRISSIKLVELSGPSGIGKSHTLKALEKECDRPAGISENDWGRWKYVSANAREHNSFETIMGSFIDQLGGNCFTGKLADRLAKCLQNLVVKEKIDHVLFMVDQVDDGISDELVLRLAGKEGPVGVQINEALKLVSPKIFLRLVITARRPRFPQKLRLDHRIDGILQLQMDALEVSYIRDMLAKHYVKVFQVEGDQQSIGGLADEIFEITGGHPGMAALIVNELAASGFVLEAGYQKEYQKMALQVIQRDIIGDLNWDEYLLLNVLSVFRPFGANLLTSLKKERLLPDDLVPDRNKVTRWLIELCETPALVRKNNKDFTRPFLVHPVLKHALPLDLKMTNPKVLHDLHVHAHKIFDKSLREMKPGGLQLLMALEMRPVYTMEALYHVVESKLAYEAGQTSEKIKQELCSLAADYRSLFDQSYADRSEGLLDIVPGALEAYWEQDEDLQMLFQRLPDGDTIHQELQNIFCR